MQKAPVRWSVFGAMVIFLLIFSAFYQPVVVLGHSMQPTLDDKQVVWMNRQHYRWHPIQRGAGLPPRRLQPQRRRPALAAPRGDALGRPALIPPPRRARIKSSHLCPLPR